MATLGRQQSILPTLALLALLTCRIQGAATQDSQLHIAAKRNDVKLLGELLGSGVRVDSLDKRGRTALLEAVLAGSTDAANALLEAQANPFYYSEQLDISPIVAAVKDGRLNMVRLMAKHGHNIRRNLHEEDTALHYACMGQTETHADLVMMLSENFGMDPLLPGKDGKTCADWANSQVVRDALRKVLIKKGHSEAAAEL
mmetsp:Transcript_5127/g.8952  ORF Transcript_5127/g.8952 Transcript_5127/m.8952 type:complete len:200 (+) Transcript_5127:85-684(+)